MSSPVTQQGAEQHQGVLHQGDDLGGGVSAKQQLATSLEVREAELVRVPLADHLLQLRLNVLLLHRRDADVLNTHNTPVSSTESQMS